MGLKLSPDPMPQESIFVRSDHYMFVKQGVPAVFLATGFANGGEAIWGKFLGPKGAYHHPDDEFSPTWDYSGIADDGLLLHTVGRNLANGTSWPQWSQDSEFRAVRDRSEAERTGAPVPVAAVLGERG